VSAPPVTSGPLARGYAWLVIRLRWLILLAWLGAVPALTYSLPVVTRAEGQQIGDLVPQDAAAIQAEIRSIELFRVPVLSRIIVVQRDPDGLSPEAQTRAVTRAVEVITDEDQGSATGIEGALPLLNTLGLFPGSREESTTAITYLFLSPHLTLEEQDHAAREFVRTKYTAEDALVGVTGAIPARLEQSERTLALVPLVEVVTIGAVVLIVGLYFRSIGPALLTLAGAAIAFLVSVRVVAWAGQRAGIELPRDLEPVIVALLLGIVTDYAIFFLAGLRSRLAAGEPRLVAAQGTTADFLRIIVTAGLIVAAGTAALLLASLDFLRAFAPALALTALVSLLVAVTFIPALLGILGPLVFWPRRFPIAEERPSGETPRRINESLPRWRARIARVMTVKPVAAVVALLCLGALVVAAGGLFRARLGFTLISGLPAGSEVVRAAEAAGRGFAPGVLSPTQVLLEGSGLDAQVDELGHFQEALRTQPGVAGVIGPTADLGALGHGLLLLEGGQAARFVLILSDDPLGGKAIDTLRAIRERSPQLMGAAGLSGARISFAGDTALAEEAVSTTFRDLVKVLAAAMVIDLLLLTLFLRGVVAPLYLLLSSALGLAAAMGLTVFLFQVVLGHDELTYYVPFGAAVLLLSLGSDYNVFVVGRIWEEAKLRPLKEAVAVAAPRAARTITVAGLVLACSFGLLAIVPLVQFREFAFVMAAGILIDALLVRSLLVPALISLLGGPDEGRRVRSGEAG
jgi:RND superfamily putative drug exporter